MTGISVFTTTSIASGGSDRESIDSVRNNAPLFFQTQGRAVTARDLASTVRQDNSGLVSTAWGGEDNTPPQYGRVYLSAMGSEGEEISDGQKESIVTLMRKKGVVSILPEFVPPNYLNVVLDGSITVNLNETNNSLEAIMGMIQGYIANYPLNRFNTSFNYGEFSVGLRLLEPAIMGDTITARITKNFEASAADPITALSFGVDNPLADSGGLIGSVLESSDILIEDGDDVEEIYLKDDGTGGIIQYRAEDGSVKNTNVGAVNYETGYVHIDNFNAIGDFSIELRPDSNSIMARNATVLTLVDGGIQLI